MDSGKPSQNRVREALGRIYEQQPPLFREYLRRYREDPKSRVFAPLAEAYRRMGRLDEAIDICREGLEHHPDFRGGRVALAKCYLDKRWFAEARGELERVVASAPENLLAQRLLGDACEALGNLDVAIHAFKMALLLSPSDVALAEKLHHLEVRRAASDNESSPADEEEPGEKTQMMALPSAAPAASGNLWSGAGAASPKPHSEPEPEKVVVSAAAADDDMIWELSDSMEPAAAQQAAPSSAASEAVDRLLGASEGGEDEAFQTTHVSQIFGEERGGEAEREITTATLADLYFSQGQYDRALRILERVQKRHSSPEIARKIQACRVRLGVDRAAILRNRQIETLKSILRRVGG